MRITTQTIAGYEMQIVELPSGNITIHIPMGEGADRLMFDTLVYHNQHVYNGKNKEAVIKQVEHWIENYKRNVQK